VECVVLSVNEHVENTLPYFRESFFGQHYRPGAILPASVNLYMTSTLKAIDSIRTTNPDFAEAYNNPRTAYHLKDLIDGIVGRLVVELLL
jgi:hypothetical protein